ncbi:hypothetical protein KIJ96_21870 (plasmid) [Pseudoalteromonas piscicida]|uniref:hypothetical protein n=1 Tax=Pseudoalteromonas piscicida TaxID=43662 RepID=UPI001D0A9227|nr:hypothetical protein [Pseudoalteromonas piscicida]UDM63602.1 hypothetical protein KIJ96_21870 [Pseudoalteromonas piscicida]
MRSTRYNGFFRTFDFRFSSNNENNGLAFFSNPEPDKVYSKVESEKWRYHIVLKENDGRKFFDFLPLALCLTLWGYLAFTLIFNIFSFEVSRKEYFESFLQLFFTNLFFSLFFLNVYPLFLNKIERRYAYFDRVKQTVSFSFDVGSDELDEFGNQCFPWLDIEAEIFEQIGDMGVPRFFVRLVHKDRDKYPKVNLCMDVVGIQNSAMYCHLRWELIIRHMDNTKPLPDIPIYELDRSKDDLTREFDKQNNRPKLFWAGFSLGEQSRLKRLYEEDAADFNFTYGPEREEIVKPWLKWKPDLTQEQVNKKQSFIKVALIQILTGLP